MTASARGVMTVALAGVNNLRPAAKAKTDHHEAIGLVVLRAAVKIGTEVPSSSVDQDQARHQFHCPK